MHSVGFNGFERQPIRNRHSTSQPRGGNSPALRLIAAVLRQALEDLHVGGDVHEDSLRWLQEVRPERPWSFEWCCDALGLHPTAVRAEAQRTSRCA